MNFSKIKIFCKERDITIPQLAEKIGVSEPGLYQMIRSESMKIDILEKIAKTLNVSITQFFDDVMTKWESQNEEYFMEVNRLREENEKLAEGSRLAELQKIQVEMLTKELELEKIYSLKLLAKVYHYRRFRLLFEMNAKSLCKSKLTNKELDVFATLIKYAEFLKGVIDYDVIWAKATFTNQELLAGINGLMKARELFPDPEFANTLPPVDERPSK